jgi:hypothetical protein
VGYIRHIGWHFLLYDLKSGVSGFDEHTATVSKVRQRAANPKAQGHLPQVHGTGTF